MLDSVDALVLGLLNVLGVLGVLGVLSVLVLLVLLLLLSGLGLFDALGLLRPELVVTPGPRGRIGPPRLFRVPRDEFSVDPTSGDGLGSAGVGISVLLRELPSALDDTGAQLTPGVITGDGDERVALPGVVGF